MWISLFDVQEITHLTCSNTITGLIEAFPVTGLNIKYCGALNISRNYHQLSWNWENLVLNAVKEQTQPILTPQFIWSLSHYCSDSSNWVAA